MSEVTDLIDCVIELAAIVHSHLAAQEMTANYDTFSPEPSDDVNDIIERLGQIKSIVSK